MEKTSVAHLDLLSFARVSITNKRDTIVGEKKID